MLPALHVTMTELPTLSKPLAAEDMEVKALSSLMGVVKGMQRYALAVYGGREWRREGEGAVRGGLARA